MHPPDVGDYEALPWIHESFTARAHEHASAVALHAVRTPVTYRDLAARVRRMAHVLRGRGVGPGDIVGVALERSPDLVTALLATLSVGAAYLPLDPDYPRERTRFMVEDSRAVLVLTRSRYAHAIAGASVAVLSVDGSVDGTVDGVEEAAPAPVTGASIAYVIYTSGSTGRPKGTMVTHAALRNRIAWMQELYRLTPADRVLQKTPSSFDVSVWEFFWPFERHGDAGRLRAGPFGHSGAVAHGGEGRLDRVGTRYERARRPACCSASPALPQRWRGVDVGHTV